MTTISPFSSASFYQMPGQSSSPGTDSLQSSGIESLAQILSNNSSDTIGNSYLDQVSLSPEAQNFLSGLSSTSTSGTTGADSNSNFTLTNSQQQQITDILNQYKDAPFTQATFNQIQNALQKAGLGTDLLSAKDQINSFNPTMDFLNALSGNTTNNSLNSQDPTNIAASEQTKSSNYMNQIYQQWQGISTTASSSSTAANSMAVTPITSTGNA